MKKNNTLFLVIAAGLIILAFTGLFDNRAISFLKDVSENNLRYLGLVGEIKLVLSSLGSTQVPFVSGETAEISNGLNKAQNYLLVVSTISFIQLMLVAISKSLLLKIVLVALFVLSLIPNTKVVSSKLLILALAINPGLILFSVVVKRVSAEATISFGTSYLTDLSKTADSLKTQKSRLMQEHDKKLTQINNGDKGIKLFSRLREDISYDVQKVKTDISGDYTELRLLIKDAGEEMIRRLLIFCTSVLFCQLLLPLGYALLIAVLFKSLFPGFNAGQVISEAESKVQAVEQEVKKQV